MNQVTWQQIERLLMDSARSQGFSAETNERSEPGIYTEDGTFLSFEKLAREVAERIER